MPDLPDASPPPAEPPYVGDPRAEMLGFRASAAMQVVHEGPEHTTIAYNAAAAGLLNGRALLGRPIRQALDPETARRYGDLADHVYSTGRDVVARGWAVRLPQPDGSTRLIHLSAVLRRWQDGERSGVCGFAVDVSGESTGGPVGSAADDHDDGAAVGGAAARRGRDRERDLALALADSKLPRALPVIPGLEMAGRSLADGDDVGGDWLDAVPLPDGRVALIVGDAVGHGAATAALVCQLRAVLNERLRGGATGADALLALDRFASRAQEAHATTVTVAELDPTSGRFTYVTAGHPPPVVLSGGRLSSLVPSGAGPLATGSAFPAADGRLGVGDVLLLGSTAIVSRADQPDQAAVDLVRLAGNLATGEVPDGEQPPFVDVLTTQVVQALARRSGRREDMALLAAQRVRPTPPLQLRLPAEPGAVEDVRRAIRRWTTDLHVSQLDDLAVQQAVGEYVGEIVRQGGGAGTSGDRPLAVDAVMGPDGLAVVTISRDGWHRGAVPGGGAPGVQGVLVANQLMDRVTVHTSDRGTAVTLSCQLSRAVQLVAGPPPSPGSDAVEPRFDVRVTGAQVRLSGTLDAPDADRLRTALLRLTGGLHRVVTVDLTRLTRLAGAGVQVLFDVRARAADQETELRLVAGSGSAAHDVLDLVRLPHDTAIG